MTNEEILEKAIQKAIDGGWKYGKDTEYHNNNGRVSRTQGILSNDYRLYIFNHDFCKALWGEELHHWIFIVPKELNKRFAGTKDLDVKPLYKYHLQQMVISKDPIAYLGDNI